VPASKPATDGNGSSKSAKAKIVKPVAKRGKIKDVFQFFREQCDSAPCVARARQYEHQWVNYPADWQDKFLAELNRCIDQCGN
jgi:hypothetical protein